MTPWYEIYRERMNERYRQHVANKYAPFIAQLYDVKANHAFEIGCGAGNITRILREMQTKVTGYPKWHGLVDACPKMLSLAIENNQHPNCAFICADVTTAGFGETQLVHSHGLLEHFDNRTIQRIVEKCAYSSPIQIHYVPGARYEKPSRGDERLLEPGEWEEILNPVAKVKVSTFNDGLDIILRIER